MTGTSSKSPMSGTSTAIALRSRSYAWSASAPSGRSRSARSPPATCAGSIVAVVGERLQRRDRDVVAVDLEEAPQRLARSRCGRSRRCRARGSGPGPTGGSGRRTRGCSRSRRRPGPSCRARHSRRRTRAAAPRAGAACSSARPRCPSRRSSVNEVTLQTSAATPKSDSSSSAAAITSRRIVPEPEQLHPRRLRRSAPARSRYMPAQDPLLGALGHRRVAVVLVHQREVVEDVLLLVDHPAQAVLDDHRDLVAEGGS